MLSTYDEGFLAAEKGRSTTWCPHDEGDPRRDQWLKGWQAGAVTKRQNEHDRGSEPVRPPRQRSI